MGAVLQSGSPMTNFLSVVLAFPTLPLTILLGIAVCYWIFALVTGVAFDGADGAADAVGGAVKGVGDAVAGSLKGVGDAVAGSVKGTADAVAGAVKSTGDAATAASEGGLLALLGFGKIPLTITMSGALLASWTICTLLTLWIRPESLLVGVPILGASIIGGLGVSALAFRPLVKALDVRAPTRQRDGLGRICTVTSTKVDSGFGMATIDDGGAGLNIHVVCRKPDALKKGDRAVVVDYDAAKNTYDVEPLDWLQADEIEALSDPTRASSVISTRLRNRS
jgi:hypothetical protein